MELATDDIWAHIVGYLDFPAKLRMQETCRRFHNMLANPVDTKAWGRVELSSLKGDTNMDVLRVCTWVQQRLKGISTLCYMHNDADGPPTMWHALVASTSGTAIRLRLCYDLSAPHAPVNMLTRVAQSELVQRLTALDICVAHPDDIALVHSLAALRQLHMSSSAQAKLSPWNDEEYAAGQESQLSRLRTLRLVDIWPDAFFSYGTAARLQQLHTLRIHTCNLFMDRLPWEMRQLLSLSRLVLVQLPGLDMMPDLRRLPALRALTISGLDGMPELGVSDAQCSDELKAALMENPLGGADGLTEVILHGVPVLTRECAEAIERLPRLKALGLEFAASGEGAFCAAMLRRRMHGRCVVQPAPEHVTNIDSLGDFSPSSRWSTDDW